MRMCSGFTSGPLQRTDSSILADSNMKLQKWCSGSAKLLAKIKERNQEPMMTIYNDFTAVVKTSVII